jgi:hypothetical protein
VRSVTRGTGPYSHGRPLDSCMTANDTGPCTGEESATWFCADNKCALASFQISNVSSTGHTYLPGDGSSLSITQASLSTTHAADD